jgi:hypothetical protein
MVPSDIALLNPNTKTCPIFRSRVDALLTKKVYSRVPVFVSVDPDVNAWGFKGLLMFMMNTDSNLFEQTPTDEHLRLYEAKMIWHFDHRWATFDGAEFRNCRLDEKENTNFSAVTRYWVTEQEVDDRVGDWKNGWFIGFRDITNATNERTVIAAVLPRVGAGNNCPLALTYTAKPAQSAALVANLNSLVLDFVARQKLGGTHLNFFILHQLPIMAPDFYNDEDLRFVSQRVLRLTYTSPDLREFARDLGYDGSPFGWEEQERRANCAELDAYYAHLYGLTRDELRYMLDPKAVFGEDFPSETFRVLKEGEMKEYGEYRTQRLVLEAYDELATSDRFRDEMPRRVSAIEVPSKSAKAGGSA